jgi:hypothetical protein
VRIGGGPAAAGEGTPAPGSDVPIPPLPEVPPVPDIPPEPPTREGTVS